MQREITVPFHDGFTWARLTEPAEPTGRAPLFVLHGGPGMAHDYVKNLDALAEMTGRTVVHYDQIGCGRSSHHSDAPVEQWVPQFFVDEFHHLRGALGFDEYHVLGQSWGGMLGAEIAVRRPAGLQGLMICNSPASMQLWLEGAARLRSELPAENREALDRHEADGTLDHPDYVEATRVFYERHVCRITPMPQDFVDSEAQMLADPTVYHTMNGPNEFHVVGTRPRLDDHRPPAADRGAHPRRGGGVRRGHARDVGAVRRAHRRRPLPRLRGSQPLHAPRDARRLPRRHRRLPRPPSLPRPERTRPAPTAPAPPEPESGAPMSKSAPEAQQSLESFGYKQELKRSMSTLDLVVYGLVFMVPIAPWAIFGVVYNAASGMVPLVYITGVVAMIFTALAYAQMSKAFPIAGSVFSYVGRGIHPTVGFFAGWAILLDYLLVPTLLYVFAASSMAGIFPDVPQWIWAVAFVIINTVINVLGIGSIKLANRVMLGIQLLFVVIFVVIAMVALSSGAIPGPSSRSPRCGMPRRSTPRSSPPPCRSRS